MAATTKKSRIQRRGGQHRRRRARAHWLGAVAIAVGAAVASTQPVAFAETPGSEDGGAAPAPAAPAEAGEPDPPPPNDDTPAESTPEPPTSTVSAQTVDTGTYDPPEVGEPQNEAEEEDEEAKPTPTPEPEPAIEPAPPRSNPVPTPPSETRRDTPRTAPAPDLDPPTVSRVADRSPVTPPVNTVAAAAPTGEVSAPPAARVQPMATTADVEDAAPSTLVVDPAPPATGFVTAVVDAAASLVTAVLAPFLAPGPATPADPPLLWAVLAWVRRDVQRDDITTSELTLSAITATPHDEARALIEQAVNLEDQADIRRDLAAQIYQSELNKADALWAQAAFRYADAQVQLRAGDLDAARARIEQAENLEEQAQIQRGIAGQIYDSELRKADALIAQAETRRVAAQQLLQDAGHSVEAQAAGLRLQGQRLRWDAALSADQAGFDRRLAASAADRAQLQAQTAQVIRTSTSDAALPGLAARLEQHALANQLEGLRLAINAIGHDIRAVVGRTLADLNFGLANLVQQVQRGLFNTTPDAIAHEVTASENAATIIDVLGNDVDAEGDTIRVVTFTDPEHGSLVHNLDGTVTYTPDPDYVGPDHFDYTVADGGFHVVDDLARWVTGGGPRTDTATVSITVGSAMETVALEDFYSVLTDGSLTVDAAEGVLFNDAAANAGPMTAELATGAAHGDVTLEEDGSFTYTPDAGFAGEDSFTYQAVSDGVASDPVSVTISVGEVAITDVVELGGDPAAVAVSPDGEFAYVVDAEAGTLVVVDLSTVGAPNSAAFERTALVAAAEESPSVVARIPIFSGFVSDVVVSADGTRVYISHPNQNFLSVVNVATNTFEGTLEVGESPRKMVVSGNRVFVLTDPAGPTAGAVAVIDTTTQTLIDTNPTVAGINPIPVGDFPVDMQVRGNFLYVFHQDRSVRVFGTTGYVPIAVYTLDRTPDGGVAISEDGRILYVANSDTKSISVVDSVTHQVIDAYPSTPEIDRIAVDFEPSRVSVHGDRAYVNGTSDILRADGAIIGTRRHLAVIDTTTNTVVTTVTLADGYGMTLSPDGRFIYAITGETQGGLGDGIVKSQSLVILTNTYDNSRPVADTPPYEITNQLANGTVEGIVNVRDPNGDSLSYTVEGAPAASVGTVDIVNPAGDWRFTPTHQARVNAEAGTGPDEITFTISVTDGGSAPVDVVITVPISPYIDTPPIVGVPGYRITNVNALTGKVTGVVNVFTSDGDTLIYSPSEPMDPADGMLVVDSSTGAWTYTPSGQARLTAFADTSARTATFAIEATDGRFTVDVPVAAPIDPAQAAVTNLITAGPGPSQMAIVGDHLYVSQDFIHDEANPTPDDHTVSVIDTKTNTVVHVLREWLTDPLGVAAVGDYLYVANQGGFWISVFDAATNTPVDFDSSTPEIEGITTDYGPSFVTVSPDGTRAYTASRILNTVSEIDTATHAVIRTIQVSPPGSGAFVPWNVFVSPDGTELYVTDVTSFIDAEPMKVVDLATGTVVADILAEAGGVTDAVVDDEYVYMSAANGILVFDPDTRTVVDTIDGQYGFLAIRGDRLYTVGTGDGDMVLTTVRIFDTTTRELVETVPLTMSAFGNDIAVSPDGTHVYVAGPYYEGDAHNGVPTVAVITIVDTTVV